MREHDWECDGIIPMTGGLATTIYGWTCKVCKRMTWTQGRHNPMDGDLKNSGVGPACPPTAWERLDAGV